MHLKFESCPADPEVWMRTSKKANGSLYFEYILLYTDYAVVISENAEDILRNKLGKYFELKESSIGPPSIYLGAKVHQVELDNGAKAWAFSPSQYVQAAVKNVKSFLDGQERYRFPCMADTPMKRSYHPELDITLELDPTKAAYYISLI